jgi:Universal stress protein UspA and related nucleotide-binding proteins
MLYRHILAAYDGSEQAKHALKEAVRIADAGGGTKLTVLHVAPVPAGFAGDMLFTPAVSPEDELQRASKLLKEAESAARGIVRFKAELAYGAPGPVILEYARACGCDLIVLGSRGLGKLREMLLGSVSHHVVQHASVPVLIVKQAGRR